MDDLDRQWCLVLPVKRLAVAKSRLGPPYDGARHALSLGFALDTAVAALACPLVGAVIVVTDEPEVSGALTGVGAVVVTDDPGEGLNAALVYGAAAAAHAHPGSPVGALAADLPALEVGDLGLALLAATGHERAFVRDAEGTGTTLLLARDAQRLRPMFGPGSAGRHLGSGAWEVDPPERLRSLRHDVDTAADLTAALDLGVGPATRRVLADLSAHARRDRTG